MMKTNILTIFAATALAYGQEAPVETKPAEEKKTPELADMTAAEDAVSIFDGKTLAGWYTSEEDKPYFKVVDGELKAGSLEAPVPRNVWLISDKNYENFELTFSVKFTSKGGPGQKNSGIQVRSLVTGTSVCGYQIDIGPTHPDKVINGGFGYWGNIWDEHRRGPLVVAENQDLLKDSVKQADGWNTYKTICNGTNIKTWINGILAHDYTEENPKIAADGILAIQAHKGGEFLFHFKDMKIKELPATEGSPKWTDEGIIKTRTKRPKKTKKNK